jgi:hydroxymethylglutaryl-CoA lyase
VEGPVSDLPARVAIREVGPRDGLQSENPLPIEARAKLITALSGTGVRKIEAVSFVSPKAVPAMADAADVWALVERRPDVAYSALVPNRRGAEAALEAGGFSSLQSFLAASDGYNVKNVGKPVEDSLHDVAGVVGVARGTSIPVEVSISASFGDPFEGNVAPERVLEVAGRVLEVGVVAISLGDTTGMATPTRVWSVVGLLRDKLAHVPLNLHFHDTRGAAMANVLAALELGGGGNVATEDLVTMLTDMGIETGVDLDRVLEAARLVETLVGHPVPSRVSKAGPRWKAGTE